jgi:hypothetical protein
VYKRYLVRLTEKERGRLETLVRRGRTHARKLLYARILLKADASDEAPAWTDERIADALETSVDTVARQRRRFCDEGLEVALMPRKPGRPRTRVLDCRAEARLVALACSEPPEGRGVGRRGCWPSGWWNSALWRGSPTRPSGGVCP